MDRPAFVGKSKLDGRDVFEVDGRLVAIANADRGRADLDLAIRLGRWVQASEVEVPFGQRPVSSGRVRPGRE